MRVITGSVAALSLLLGAGVAQAATKVFTAVLSGAGEVPANAEPGKGLVRATLDTDSKVLTYKVTYSDLTGPGLMAHFHGPADAGVNAPPVVAAASAASPIAGSATLTDGQIADLEAGRWYFNVHTTAHKGGEIRGQLTPAS